MLETLRRSLCAALLGAATLTAGGAASAQNTNPAAVQLFEDGRRLMGEGNYADACPKLAESARLSAAVGTYLNLAKCYEAVGKTASAWTSYKAAVFLGKKLNDDRVPLAEQKAVELEPKLMRLQIKASGDVPGATIRQDDQDVGKGALSTPIPADPGDHLIEATAPGYSVWATHVQLSKAGEVVTVIIPALTPKPVEEQPAARSSALRPAAYAVGGLGVVGLALGGVFGGLALGAKSTLTGECPKGVCRTLEGQADRASADSKALISTVGFGVGGAALATGIVLFVVSRPSAKRDDAPATPLPHASLLPSFGPDGGGLTLAGSF